MHYIDLRPGAALRAEASRLRAHAAVTGCPGDWLVARRVAFEAVAIAAVPTLDEGWYGGGLAAALAASDCSEARRVARAGSLTK